MTLPANGHVSDLLDCSKRQLISGYQCKYLMCAIGCVYNTGTPGLAHARGALRVTYIWVDHWVDHIRVLDVCRNT